MNFKWIYALGLIFLLISCAEDPGIGPIFDGPEVNLESGVGLTTSSVDLVTGENFAVRVSATAGDLPMNAFSVQRNGVNIPAENLAINGSVANSNPVLLFGDDKQSLNYDVSVLVDQPADGASYDFVIMDEGSTSVSQRVTVNASSTPPALDLNGADVGSITVSPEQLLRVNVSAATGSGDIATIAVYENGELISDLTRLDYDDTEFASNPHSIPASDQGGFERPIFIRMPMATGPMTFTIEITDELNVSTSANISVNVGTPVNSLMGVLLNSAGPAGTGGLDLDSGTGTGSSDASAEIKDEGIDTDMTTANNWIQKISGVNGSEIKYLIPGQNGLSESFSFESVSSVETVASVFENGQALTETNDDGELTTGVIHDGDLLSVKNGDKYYLIRIVSVNIVVDGNGDSYEMDIKL